MIFEELLERGKNSKKQIENFLDGRCFCGENRNASLYFPTKRGDKEDFTDLKYKRIYLYCDVCAREYRRYHGRKLTEKELFTIKILCQ